MKNRIQWREPAGKTVSVAIAGDFSPREFNSDDVAARAEEIASEIKGVFEQSDLCILQLECAVTRKDTPIPKSGPNHRCHEECLNFLKALGIDTVLLANNHTGDYGTPGIQDTLNNCRAAGLRTVGIGMDAAAAEAPLILSRSGMKIALLNRAEHEFGIAEKNSAGSAGLDPLGLAEQIKNLKACGHLVWVALHGGHEHYPFPSPRLRQLCRFLADCGADLVFNCHSHCPCGYEIYHNVPLVYSPGNFYFPNRPTSLPCWYIGYLPKFFCDGQGTFALELTPYYNRKDKIRLMDEKDSEHFFRYLDVLNQPIQDTASLERLFDAWCTHSGAKGYLGTLFNLPQPASLKSCTGDINWLAVKNLFSCESHHDLLRRTLLLMEQGRLEEAERHFAEIAALQTPGWVALSMKE